MHIPLALVLSPEPEAPVSREQGVAVQEEPVHLSFCSWYSPAFLVPKEEQLTDSSILSFLISPFYKPLP